MAEGPRDAPAPAEPGSPDAEALGALLANAPQVLDALDTAITFWDSTLHCVWSNLAGAALQSRSREALIGASAAEILGAERLQALMPHIEAVMRGEMVEIETQRLREGRRRYSRVKGLPRRLPDGRIDGFIVLTTDVTEEHEMREAARELAASEAKFRALADSLPVGVYQSDARARNIYTNQRWQEIAGLTFEQGLGDGWRAGVHPDDREAVFGHWRETAAAGGEFEMAIRLVRPDGTVRQVVGRGRALRADDGTITGYVGTNEDVTDRLAAERALLESRAALVRSNEAQRLLYEQTPAMLHGIDPEGRLVSVSDRWLTTLGWQRHEVLGRPAVDFLTPGSRDAVLAEYLPRLWRGGREDRLSLQMQRRDGTVMDVLLSAVVQYDEAGRPVRALAVTEDVTTLLDRAAQLRREQAARAELERQAAELARLASERREMLDLLAHEVRQPLNNASAAIESAAAMLAGQGGDQGAAARLVRAQRVLAEVQQHVDNTLAMSTLLVASPTVPEEEADIDTVVAVALAELPHDERARVTVLRQTPARTALMDSALVRLALRNLLGNAIRHTAPGTPVTVLVSDSDAPLALLIDVIDEGAGLPAELRSHLFERGARVRHRDGRESHGLGLFIAHRALKAQGGDLRLLYTGPAGTALRLVLPQGHAG
jgi:PAS domain S-box-containing protein